MSFPRLSEDYRIEREIGRGAFATVYLATHTPTQRVLAIKAVRTTGLTRKLADALAAEVSIMQTVRAEHIVRLEEVVKSGGGDGRLLCLIMEWCEGGDLGAYLRKQEGSVLEESRARMYTVQLSRALKVLHDNSLVHRDLKPQNLLLNADASILKLADFGFARYVQPDDLAETLCGSPLYMVTVVMMLIVGRHRRSFGTKSTTNGRICGRWGRFCTRCCLGGRRSEPRTTFSSSRSSTRHPWT